MNIHKVKAKKDTRVKFFKNRTVNFWNELPAEVKNAPSLNTFKNYIDKYWEQYDIMFNYDKCVEFVKERMSMHTTGSGNKAMVNVNDDTPNRHDEITDLEIQAHRSTATRTT